MQEIIDALKAAGFTYKEVMEPSFDYPLDFFIRDSDGAHVLGDVEEAARGIIVRLRPFDLLAEWYIEDFDLLPDYIAEFKENFERMWQVVKEWN